MSRFFYIFLSTLVLFVFSKEYLTLNEETLLISAFFLFFYFSYNALSHLVSEFLNDRSNQIFESINQALALKRLNLIKLRSAYSLLLSSANSLLLIFSFLKSLRNQKLVFWNKLNVSMFYGVVASDLELLYELDLLTLKYFNTLKLNRVVVE